MLTGHLNQKRTMKKIVKSGIKNWKTTLLGIVIAGLELLKEQGGEVTDWKTLGAAFAIAAWGLISRDSDKSSEQSGL